MAIEGTLSDLNILELFQMLAQQEKVGDLEIIYEKGKKVIITFMKGEILDIDFSDQKKSMIQFLLEKNVIREFEIKDILKKAKKRVRKVTTLLEEEGILTQLIKNELVTLYFKESIFEVLLYRKGDFKFNARNLSEDQVKTFDMVPISVDEILLEAVRQQDELSLIKKKMPIKNALISKNETIVELNTLSKNETEVYQMITERIKIEEIFKNLWIPRFDVLTAIYSLYQKEYITIFRALESSKEETLKIDFSQWGRWLKIGIFSTILLFFIAISLGNTINKLRLISFSIIKTDDIKLNKKLDLKTKYYLKHSKEPSDEELSSFTGY